MLTFNCKEGAEGGHCGSKKEKEWKYFTQSWKSPNVDHFWNLSKLKEKRVNWASEKKEQKKNLRTLSGFDKKSTIKDFTVGSLIK